MIFFDIDDTLVTHSLAQTRAALLFWDAFADRLPHARQDFPAIWGAVMAKHFAEFAAGRISFDEHRLRRMREILGSEDDAVCRACFQAYLECYERGWALFDDVPPCLKALSGTRLGIISNGSGEQQRQKLRRLGPASEFTTIIISEEVGMWKPEPGIFREACRQARVPAQDCVYVGDGLVTDARASRAAGMRGIWLNRNGSPPPDAGVPVIGSLSELPALLAGHRRGMC